MTSYTSYEFNFMVQIYGVYFIFFLVLLPSSQYEETHDLFRASITQITWLKFIFIWVFTIGDFITNYINPNQKLITIFIYYVYKKTKFYEHSIVHSILIYIYVYIKSTNSILQLTFLIKFSWVSFKYFLHACASNLKKTIFTE